MEHPFYGCLNLKIIGALSLSDIQNGYEMMYCIWILVERTSSLILRQTGGLRCSDEDWTLKVSFWLILQTESVHEDWIPMLLKHDHSNPLCVLSVWIHIQS